jgi:phosphate transport system substrate-binding protein
MTLRIFGICLLALAMTFGFACGSDDKDAASTSATPWVTQAAATATNPTAAAAGTYRPRKVVSSVNLSGAGATFPNPFYTKAFDEYRSFDSNVKVNYQSIGSSGGIKNFTEKTVDFGATDAYMTNEQLTAAGGPGNVFHIPTAAGAVVVTFNIPNFSGSLKLSPETLSGIFLGDIKKWNDPKLVADNAGVNLPNANIAVVHRADGSGTTNTFTSYLAKVSPVWKERVGAGTSVKWPTGIGANGNEGVTGQIKQTPGALGYVELIYAEQNKLPTAELKNKAGTFVKPSLAATSAALADPNAVNKDTLNADLLDTAGETAYPIVTLTWLLVYKNQPDQLKAEALTNVLWWLTHGPGQQVASNLQYAPLPREILPAIEAKLRQISVGGTPVIQ